MRWLKGYGLPGMFIAGFVGIFGFIMLSALALFMFSEYDVVSTENEVHAAANGTVTGTVNSTAYYINSNHYEFGWLFSVLSLMFGLLCIVVMWKT